MIYFAKMLISFFKNKLLLFLPYLFIFIASLYQPYDADLGWHLKYGEYFLQNGKILRDNIFSTMMPDYRWANHSWATDPIIYIIYNNFSFFGLTILGAIVITLTFYLFSKAFRLSLWNKVLIFPILIYLLAPVNSISFRSQLVSYLFTGALFLILSRYKEHKQYLYFLPILFIIWANLHGGFILGIMIFFLWIILYLFEEILFIKKEVWQMLKEVKISGLIFILSAIVTLFNPFGISIYNEIVDRVNNPWRTSIAEWSPFIDLSGLWWNQIIVINLIVAGGLFLVLSGKIKQNLLFVIATILVFSMTFFERRYAWTAYYLLIIFLIPVTNFFKPDSKKQTVIASCTILLITLILVVIIKNPFNQYYSMSWDIYCRKYMGCSNNALKFLKKATYNQTELLTPYNWGGWIIWNYPQIKPGIDGRMHLWKDNNNYSAFGEYYPLEQNLKDINKSKYNIVLMSSNKPMYNRLVELSEMKKWKMVYKDKYSGIFMRNKR